MSEKKEYKEFREMLKEAVATSGYKDQKAFAKAAGMSVEHLSRMLKNETIGQPTQETLKKIMKVSSVDSKKLFESCGYGEKQYRIAIKTSRNSMSEYDHMEAIAKDIVTTGNSLVKSGKVYSGIHEILENFVHNGPEINRVSVFKINENVSGQGESAISCWAEWNMPHGQTSYYRMRSFFVLYALPVVHNQYVLTNVFINGEQFVKNGCIPSEVLSGYGNIYGNIREIPFFCSKADEKEYPAAEQKLLKAIFGYSEKDPLEIYNMHYGIGTVCKGIPSNTKEYILENEDILVSSDKDKDLSECLKKIDSDDTEEMEHLFSDFHSGSCIDVILKILNKKYKDADLPGEVEYLKSDMYQEFLKPVLMVREDYYSSDSFSTNKKIQEKISNFLIEEFKLLGFETFGMCVAYYQISFDIGGIESFQKPI